MINILDMKLNTVETTESIIINKKKLDGDKMKITISRKCEKGIDEADSYIGNCIAELRLASEENLDILDCSFAVRVSLTGYFTCNNPKTEITDEQLQSSIMFELLPHVRACMASTMTIAGVTPYMIPNSIIPGLQ